MDSISNKTQTVSVVMCTYNGALYIQKQLESILAQSYPIYELIIQDDCSTDSTFDIIREYEKRYDFIHCFLNEQNLGFNSNFINAIKKATGDYIAIADQDDIWLKNKLEKQVESIKDYDICYSAYFRDKCDDYKKWQNIIYPIGSIEKLTFGNIIPGHSLLIRQKFIEQMEKWGKHIHYDWWLLMNAALKDKIIEVKEPLNWHRPHSQSAIAVMHKKYKPNKIEKPTFQPYFYGFASLNKLKDKRAWKEYYEYLYLHTSNEKKPLVHQISTLLLKKDFFSTLQLCFLCLKYKEKICPQYKNGIMSYIRAFFYPAIFAFNNTNYEL